MMDVIDDDCLSYILHFLSFHQRVHSETVCTRWLHVLKRQSTFRDIRSLNIADYFSSSSTDYYQQEPLSFLPTVLGIVERCGNYVHELTFGERWHRIRQPIMDSIADYCHNLRSVNLSAVILSADISGLLARVAPRLHDFALNETSWCEQQHADKVPLFFSKMCSIRRLQLRSAMFSLESIVHLPHTITYLDISGAHSFPADAFEQFLSTHKQLEHLHLSPIPVASQPIIAALSSLPSLRTLSLGYLDRTDLELDSLARLEKLEHLCLQSVQCISEMSLRRILSSLPVLSSLTLAKCKNIFDYSALEACTRLHTLHIADTMQLSNEDLHTLSSHGRLENLSLSNCFNLTSPAVNHTLHRCQLKQLHLINCRINDNVMYTVASTQKQIENISVQACNTVTSKGVSALAWLRNVSLLKEVDVSRNRNVDDMAILSLHNALTLDRRSRWLEDEGCSSDDEYECCGDEDEEGCREDEAEEEDKLTLYVLHTSVSSQVQDRVADLIRLAY